MRGKIFRLGALDWRKPFQPAGCKISAKPSASDIQLAREGASWLRQLMMLVVLGGVTALLLRIIGSAEFWLLHRLEVLVALGGIACWRWSWFLLQNVRAVAYRYYTFPRLRSEATEAVARYGPLPAVTVLPTP